MDIHTVVFQLYPALLFSPLVCYMLVLTFWVYHFLRYNALCNWSGLPRDIGGLFITFNWAMYFAVCGQDCCLTFKYKQFHLQNLRWEILLTNVWEVCDGTCSICQSFIDALSLLLQLNHSFLNKKQQFQVKFYKDKLIFMTVQDILQRPWSKPHFNTYCIAYW